MQAVKNEYARAFAFLKGLKWYFLAALLLFILSGVVSYFVFMEIYNGDPEMIKQHMSELVKLMEEKDVTTDDGGISAWGLFCNNLIASLSAVGFGVIPFLFVPLLTLAINAILLGMVAAIMGASLGGGAFEMIVSVAPHGIFEIPALLICIASGMLLCKRVSGKMLYRGGKTPLSETVLEMSRMLVLIVVPMLIAAALIEAYITPLLMQALIK